LGDCREGNRDKAIKESTLLPPMADEELDSAKQPEEACAVCIGPRVIGVKGKKTMPAIKLGGEDVEALAEDAGARWPRCLTRW
jgi:hypothetical protein